jgi:hypothetical protein
MMQTAQIANQNTHIAQTASIESMWEINNRDFLAQADRLTMNDYDMLRALLSGIENDDSYATSAAYYLMTCRKGLWIYKQEDMFMIFGWHPNVTGQILIFNPLQNKATPLLQSLAHAFPAPPAGIIVARVQNNNDAIGHQVQEAILDWVYPVQTLLTHDVTEHKGTRFRDLRKNLYRVDSHNISLKPLQEHKEFMDAMSLITGWSESREDDNYKLDDLSDPQVYILKLLRLYPSSFEGFALYNEGRIAGVCIWEKSNRETITSFVSVTRPDLRGMSDYIIFKMCQQLQAQGATKVCIGGSESAGLDAFKRKFNPVHSLNLQTFSVSALKTAQAA